MCCSVLLQLAAGCCLRRLCLCPAYASSIGGLRWLKVALVSGWNMTYHVSDSISTVHSESVTAVEFVDLR